MALRSPPQGIAVHRTGRSAEGGPVISLRGILGLSRNYDRQEAGYLALSSKGAREKGSRSS